MCQCCVGSVNIESFEVSFSIFFFSDNLIHTNAHSFAHYFVRFIRLGTICALHYMATIYLCYLAHVGVIHQPVDMFQVSLDIIILFHSVLQASLFLSPRANCESVKLL